MATINETVVGSDVSVNTNNQEISNPTLPENINWGLNQETLDYIYNVKGELNQLSKSMVEKAILIGNAFYHVQQKSKDGEFRKWIKDKLDETKLKKSSVYDYIALFRNADIVKDAKSIREALMLIGSHYRNGEKKGKRKPTDSFPEISSFKKAVEKLDNERKKEILQQMIDYCQNSLKSILAEAVQNINKEGANQ